ncbi:cornifelin homolog B-like [Gouania willdenowi]|uniref:Cornifelin homolog B-like n=1 Tax=Gouania willdenowi TaxID=441366 RepID=A0A8C5DX07_GOUWI|nr:cornifelin homolog B-like [Gouania willdenowi]
MTQTLVVTQPLPVMDIQDSQEWGSGMCDCCDNVPECCFAYWCFPCFACTTSREYGEALCLPLAEYLGFAFPAVTMSMRVSMRQRYGIRGTMCNDCVLSCFCGPCLWCQMSREMKKRKIPVVLVSKNFS